MKVQELTEQLMDILGDNSTIRTSFKNLNVRPFYLPMVHRYKKCSDILEVTSGDRAEIENVKNDRASSIRSVIFSSATRCHFLNVNALFTTRYHCTKKNLSDFEKMVFDRQMLDGQFWLY